MPPLHRTVPLALLALALVGAAAGCGGGDGTPAALAQPPQTAPTTTATTTPAAREARDAPRTPAGQLTVHVTRSTRLYAAPGGRVVTRIAPRTEFGLATVLPVVRRRGQWLGVLSKSLPNGRVGWISANAALVPYRTRWSVSVSLRHRVVVVRRAGRTMQRFTVAVGSPSTPTPTGRFAVTDKLFTGDPGSPYGCCILALNAHQPRTPQGWGGGDRVAIHATNLPESIGTAASLGCMRGPADQVRRAVNTVPLGTVVTIRA